MARQLAELGLQVRLFGTKQGSSHNIPQLLIRAYPEKTASTSHRLYQCAFEQAKAFYQLYCSEQYQQLTLMTPQGPQHIACLDAAAAIAVLRQHKNISYHESELRNIQQYPDQSWQMQDDHGQLSHCQTLLLCTADIADTLDLALPISPCAGQVIHVDVALKQGFADGVHALPLGPRTQIGSSYRPGESDISIRNKDSAALLQNASQLCENIESKAIILASYAANRSTSADHLPLIGPAPDLQHWATLQQQHERQRSPAKKPQAPLLTGLWLNLAHGSRGGTMAPLAAQLLSAALQNRSLPLENDLLDAIHPGRFATRETRRRAEPEK